MGRIYNISCKICGASAGLRLGKGMFCSNGFESLFLNHMETTDRIKFAQSLPKEYRNEIKTCHYGRAPLRCSNCKRYSSKLVWKIELKSGWSYEPPLKCPSCNSELQKVHLPLEGDFEGQCWECRSRSLNIQRYGTWN